jgi:hypothetical protein
MKEDCIYQNVPSDREGHSYGRAMQETGVSSDDPVHGGYVNVPPMHSRAVAVQSSSYRLRSQSHSGTEDSPRIASHRKSCK